MVLSLYSKTNTMEKQQLTISQTELLTLLMNVDKSTFVNILSVTKVRMNKTGNPYYEKVFKLSKCNYLIGNTYQDRVQSNEVKEGGEGTFESLPSSVGTHTSKCVLFNEKLNTHYLQFEYFDEIKPQVEYVCDGNPIEKELFESYMGKKSETTRQPQDRIVKVQTFKIESIKEISLNGTKYTIEG